MESFNGIVQLKDPILIKKTLEDKIHINVSEYE